MIHAYLHRLYAGLVRFLSSETGILIDQFSREYMVEQFATQIDLLAENAVVRKKLGDAAILHVKQNFLWEDKINKIIDIYHSLV